ncbi:hypothetical protein JAAARDRAFT_35979 [Jaapia argillacea MUCL 33604]|uniref:Xylanolytic transcriptional activator regulatory domain-containing protein n=1 Tax=Jaapia argillacea MUCL 33604 TaxID=933084 RepID=A0A067Q440_9AGAM|nr:hypothetical protein JAAARDRAFT_35979 [Jaapia argillacea MUCL 33604]
MHTQWSAGPPQPPYAPQAQVEQQQQQQYAFVPGSSSQTSPADQAQYINPQQHGGALTPSTSHAPGGGFDYFLSGQSTPSANTVATNTVATNTVATNTTTFVPGPGVSPQRQAFPYQGVVKSKSLNGIGTHARPTFKQEGARQPDGFASAQTNPAIRSSTDPSSTSTYVTPSTSPYFPTQHLSPYTQYPQRSPDPQQQQHPTWTTLTTSPGLGMIHGNGSNPGLGDGAQGVSPSVFDSPMPMSSFSYGHGGIVPTVTGIHPNFERNSHKRPRKEDEQDEFEDRGMNGEGSKRSGACGRCKGLKVRCVFSENSDICQRCLPQGHPCIIPGKKKRRPPAKREELMKKIQSQADDIRKLMDQLEASNRRHQPHHDPFLTAGTNGSNYASSVASITSPSPDLASSSADLASSSSPLSSPTAQQPDVKDWIAKARASLRQFDGLILLGGTMTKNLVVEGDPEESESESDGEEFEVAVEGPDDEMSSEGQDYFSAAGSQTGASGSKKRPGQRASSVGSASQESVGLGKKGGVAAQEKPANIPPESSPFGLMASLAYKKEKGKARSRSNSFSSGDDEVGVANDAFFRPAAPPDPVKSVPEKTEGPVDHILARGIVTLPEVHKLFKIYFDYMNLSLSLLDPVLYTAESTYIRSPFLFTVVCAIASRYYTERPDLYPIAMNYARLAAGTALISGQKNIEMVQAYILLSLYPVPARRWEEDRGWIYLGLAIRIATDLNLHLPTTAKPVNEQHAREMLNRTRVWLNCFNLDRSTGSQYGKAPIIKNTDYVANRSEDWWDASPHNMKNFDIHICCYNNELRVMSAFTTKIYSDPNHPTGLNKVVDFEALATSTDDELKQLGDKWFARLEKTDLSDPQNRFRTGLLKLAYSYARLVALSFGFQHAFGKSQIDENPFLMRCLRAASDVVNAFVDDIGVPSQRIYLRHGPEAQSVFVTFASAFLVKLLQPKFAQYLTVEQRVGIRNLVQKVIDLLGSPEVSIDTRHGPKLYARFLKGLLNTPLAVVERSSTKRSSSPQPPATRQGPTIGANPDLENFPEPFNHSSPSSSYSLSPPPSHESVSFDQFAPMGMGVDPFGSHPEFDVNALGMSDFFQPPLPYDDELLNQMQALASNDWMEPLPGFSWMGQLQQQKQQQLSNPQTQYPPTTQF